MAGREVREVVGCVCVRVRVCVCVRQTIRKYLFITTRLGSALLWPYPSCCFYLLPWLVTSNRFWKWAKTSLCRTCWELLLMKSQVAVRKLLWLKDFWYVIFSRNKNTRFEYPRQLWHSVFLLFHTARRVGLPLFCRTELWIASLHRSEARRQCARVHITLKQLHS